MQDKFKDGSWGENGNRGKRRPIVSAKGQRIYQVAVKRFGRRWVDKSMYRENIAKRRQIGVCAEEECGEMAF